MDNVPNTLTILKESHVVWNWHYKDDLCIPFPWPIGKKCVTIEAGVSILENDGIYSLDVNLLGKHVSLALFSGCHTVLSVGVAQLDICLEPEMVGGVLKAFQIEIKVCIGLSVAGINLRKCWTLYNNRIGVILRKDLPKEIYDPWHQFLMKGENADEEAPKYITLEL